MFQYFLKIREMNIYEVRAQPDTFLSPLVRNLLVEIGNTFQQDIITSRLYLTPSLTFNWLEIQKLIGELSDCFNIHKQQSEWFSTIIYKVWPVFVEANQTLRNCSSGELEHLWNLCKWTQKETEIKQYFSYFISGFPTSIIEAVLFLTAVLERSLGNVFLLKGDNVPFLLRDLLSTEELRSILGIVPTVFIQVLQGTPQALNLRNIVWHGFPSPEEIKPELGATLFIIIGSIGEILSQMHIDINSLPCRPQVSNLMYHSHMLEGCFLQLNMEHKVAIKAILFSSPHIAKSHQIYWDKLLEHYYTGRYGECVLLLLPQMEHMLRSVFCWLNRCPERVLTAESTSFYTTFDEILLENVNDNTNQIRTILGDNIIVMLQDIFAHHKGPRIRDKVSHGECDLNEIPQILINHIICVALAIVLRLHVENDTLKKQEYPSTNNITSVDSCTNEIIDLEIRIREACEKYESKFHSSSLLKTAIVNATEELVKWKECPRPEKIQEFEFRTWEEAQQDDKTEIPHLKQELWSVLQRKLNLNENDYENNFYDFINSALINRILTLYRPKIENDILNTLQRIVDNIHFICVQVQDGLKYRYNLLSSRQLRSRQRDTYQRMLKTVPCLYSAVQYMILLLVIHLLSINNLSSVSSKDLQYIQRYLKHVLQYVQNVTTYTSTEKNRWDELQSATFSFSQQMLQSSKQNYILNTALKQ